jgi:hypothetical protein
LGPTCFLHTQPHRCRLAGTYGPLSQPFNTIPFKKYHCLLVLFLLLVRIVKVHHGNIVRIYLRESALKIELSGVNYLNLNVIVFVSDSAAGFVAESVIRRPIISQGC